MSSSGAAPSMVAMLQSGACGPVCGTCHAGHEPRRVAAGNSPGGWLADGTLPAPLTQQMPSIWAAQAASPLVLGQDAAKNTHSRGAASVGSKFVVPCTCSSHNAAGTNKQF